MTHALFPDLNIKDAKNALIPVIFLAHETSGNKSHHDYIEMCADVITQALFERDEMLNKIADMEKIIDNLKTADQ